MSSATGYVLLYVIFLIPTYILPYFGSNSSIANAIHAGLLGSLYPLFWIHLSIYVAICLLAWLRGPFVQRAWLIALPAFAAVFEFVPGLNLVPLLPTVLNLLCIVLGVRPTTDAPPTKDAQRQSLPLKLGLCLPLILICWGMAALGYAKLSGKRPNPPQVGVKPSLGTAPSAPSPQVTKPVERQAESPTSAPLSTRWIGTWTDGTTKQQLVISSNKFGDCTWVGSATAIPKRAGCWAYYGRESLTVKELVDATKFKVDAQSLALARSIGQTERYRTVQTTNLDHLGSPVGDDGGTVYLIDGDSIFAIISSVEGPNSDLVVRVNKLVSNARATNAASSSTETAIRDNFNGSNLDAEIWVSKGNKVVLRDGYVSLQAAQTDNVGQLWTKALPKYSVVRIRMRHWMQPSGERPFFPMLVLRDANQQPIADLRWLKSNDPPTYCGDANNYDKVLLHVGQTMCAVVTAARSSDFFGVWVDTQISYDRRTGRYTASSQSPTSSMRLEHTVPADQRKVVGDVYLSSYGWFTGHEHRIDSIVVEGEI